MILPYKSGVSVRVVSPYGWRKDPFTGEDAWHSGVDLVSMGDKTVVSVADGVVGVSTIITDPTNRTSEWGNYVRVDGYGGRKYYFCHLSERLVTAGQEVSAGDVIGVEGSTGRSTGSHLHLEVRYPFDAPINAAELLGIPNIPGTVAYINPESEVTEEMEDETMEDEKKPAENSSEPNEWAKEAVEWAVENGIIYGTGDGELKLRDSCTREQMMVFLHRFAQLIGKA